MPPGGLQISLTFVLCALIGGFAPSSSAIVVVWLSDGHVDEFLRQLLRFRVGADLYLCTLIPFATASVATIVHGVVGLPLKMPDSAVIGMALVWPAMAALGEEIGWRAFMFALLVRRRTFGHIGASLVVGVVWGVWHLPADFIGLANIQYRLGFIYRMLLGLKAYGDWFFAAFLVNGPMILTAHALCLGWLWKRSDGNVLLMVLYHASITASAMLLPTAGEAGKSGVVGSFIGASIQWIVACFLWLCERRRV